jgi:predicted RNA methylase
VSASAAAVFAAAGLLDEAASLLEPLGWDGELADATSEASSLGEAYQSLVDPTERRRRGVHYTPSEVAAGLVRAALRDASPSARVCDPTCGGGAFLVAAAEVLRQLGAPVERIVAEQLHGVDLDPTAVAVARLEVACWALAATGRLHVVPEAHLIVGDGLVDGAAGAPYDAVLGNPPFGSQLRGSTVRDAARRADVHRALELGPLGYADDAGLFLARACALAAPGGVVALVLPRSLLTARDGVAVRRAVGERAEWVGVWAGGDDVGFSAAVQVWAPLLRTRGGSTRRAGPIRRYVGASVVPADTVREPPGATSWAPLVADLAGGHDLDVERDCRCSDQRLGDVATATAGFRRQFYGLIPHVVEAPSVATHTRYAKLVTTGAIDPLHLRWGDTPIRFGGTDRRRPVVDLAGLGQDDPGLAAWVEARLVPKVVVASQGRVIEAVLDEPGELVPSTPVVSVEPRPDGGLSAAHLAALLTSPVAAAWVHRHAAGSGLGTGRCRISAGLLATLPLPADRAAWDTAAARARAATVAAGSGDAAGWEAAWWDGATQMCRAFGIEPDDPVVAWWRGGSPDWRDARPWTT